MVAAEKWWASSTTLTERRPMEASWSPRHAAAVHIVAIAVFTLLTVSRALPILVNPAHIVTPDPIDPVFNSWDLASVVHNVLAWRHGLWSFFDANVYYPTPHPASYTDAAVGILPLSLPLHFLLQNPIVVLNVLTGLSFVLSAYGAFVLGHRLTGNYTAAFIAGLTFGFCPLRTEHLGHINILSTEWLILSAAALVVAWRSERRLWWALAGLLLGLSAVTNLYYLAYLVGPLLLSVLLLRRDWTPKRIGGMILAGTIAIGMIAPFLVPYLARNAAVGARYGSAASLDVLSFLQVLPGRPLDSAVLPNVPIEMMQPNHGFFPGIVPTFLVFIAIRKRKATPWAIFAAACALIALGPQLVIHGRALGIPLPYALLARYVPHFSLFRDPPRAMMGSFLGVAVVAAYGARELVQRQKSRARRLTLEFAMVGVTALELWSPVPTQPIPAIGAGEHWLARQPRIHVVVELPITSSTPLDWARQSAIMYDSTVHWKLLVNGSSSVEPAGMSRTRLILSSYPSPAAIDLLRMLHADAVVLRLTWLSPGERSIAERVCRTVYRDATEQICVGPWNVTASGIRPAARSVSYDDATKHRGDSTN